MRNEYLLMSKAWMADPGMNTTIQYRNILYIVLMYPQLSR